MAGIKVTSMASKGNVCAVGWVAIPPAPLEAAVFVGSLQSTALSG